MWGVMYLCIVLGVIFWVFEEMFVNIGIVLEFIMLEVDVRKVCGVIIILLFFLILSVFKVKFSVIVLLVRVMV